MATGTNKPEEIQKGVKELEREITCPVCHDHFQEPKILPCCHYYCKGCVQALVRRAGPSKPFPCPECRSDTFLPQNDPDQLPTAFFVNRLKELYTKMEKVEGKVEALCELCTGAAATAFCRQCAEFICDKCTEAHRRMKMFAGHKLTALEELKEGGVKIPVKQAPPPTCKVHDEQMKIYCYECKHLICRDCVIDDHAGHKYEFVKKATPAVKQKLAEHLAPLKEVQVSLYDANKTIKSTKYGIKLQGASASANIEQTFQELHDILEQRKRELLEKVSSLVKGKLDSLSVQEKGIDMASGAIQSLVEFVEQNIQNSTEEELMTIHTQVLIRIDEEVRKHQQTSADLEPVEEADIVVEVGCAGELKKLCQEKTKVRTYPVDCTVTAAESMDAEVNKTSQVELHMDQDGKPSLKRHTVKAKLLAPFSESVVEAKVQQKKRNTYEIEYTPHVRGHHQLEITVNGLPVAGSPFPVLVKIHPTQLSKPIRIVTGLRGFGVALMSTGEVVFAENRGDILILDRTGRKLRSIKRSQHGFRSLFGIAVDDNDNLYVTDDMGGCLFKFDRKGTKVKAVKPTLLGFDPMGIAVSGNQVIVAANNQLFSYTRDLELVKTIKVTGNPIGIACDLDGKMYVCSYHGHCVQVLSTQGELLYSFSDKNNRSLKLSKPHSICINGVYVYVTEWGNCVSVFTKEGKFITSFGNNKGQFNNPSGLAINNDAIYVCDCGNNHLLLF